MQTEFIRFKASDEVELQGWFSDPGGETAVLHIHGMSGNGYENYYLDNLRELYTAKGLAFFTIDSRGRGIISDFRQGDGWKHAGSCYELFDESLEDLQGALEYLKSRGKKRFILEGHSLGCTKVVNYWVNRAANGVEVVILLAPTDMVGWANTDANHEAYMTKAKQLVSETKGEELVGAQCWIDKTPISAQTYATICDAGSSADIYGERENRALLGRVGIPMLIAYGTADIGITEIDGSIEKWQQRVTPILNANTQVTTIDGASHGFRGLESTLAEEVSKFLEQLS